MKLIFPSSSSFFNQSSEFWLSLLHRSKRCASCSSSDSGKSLLAHVCSLLSNTKGRLDLSILGKVEGSDLLSLLNLLLVGLDLGLHLVDQRLHAESLSLGLGLRLQCRLHVLNSLAVVLLDQNKLLFLLGNSANNLLLNLVEFQLTSQNLVLLLLKSCLSLGQSSLQLHLLSLQSLADLVDLVDGASSLADLVHDVLDLIGQGLVLTSDLIKLDDTLLVGRLHLEQVRGDVSCLLLRVVQVAGQRVHLLLPLTDHLVVVLGLSLQLGVHHLGLVQVHIHLLNISLNLGSSLLTLMQLGVEVLDGGLSLGETSLELHLGHLQLLSLGHGLLLVLLSPHAGLALRLAHLSQHILSLIADLLELVPGTISLVLQVAVLAQQKTSLPGLPISSVLGLLQLSSQ